jgi:Rieske Fe-S protein
MTSKRGQASNVGTYLGPGAFRAKDAAKRLKASQERMLPPRCSHAGCRVSWDTRIVQGTVHCATHQASCDASCGIELME